MPDDALTLYDIIKALALPPGSLIVLLAVGLLLALVGLRRLGLLLIAGGTLLFYLLATPLVAGALGQFAQADAPLKTGDMANAQAIVVLSAGLLPYAPEYPGGNTIDETTLARLAYAAYLKRQTDLPILVSGGASREVVGPLAELMKKSLENSFGVKVAWTEDKSRDTFENARFSAEILKRENISRILLVTHAAHMPRSVTLFEREGLTVIPAPTGFTARSKSYIGVLVPRQSALATSYYAIYELFGSLWYALNGRT